MSAIHMETEQVRKVAHQLEEWGASILSKGDALRTISGALSIAWQSGRSEEFQKDYSAFLRAFDSRMQELQELALRLMREADEWEQIDANGLSDWNKFGRIPSVIASNGPKPVGSAQVGEKFSWFKFASDTTKQGLKLLKGIPYDSTIRASWKGTGRWFNAVFGNKRAGWVGTMDRLGHIIRKNPVITKGLPVGFGIANDLLDGDRLDRAVGSEILESASELISPMAIGGAIGAIIGGVSGATVGGVGAIPGVMAGAVTGAKVGVAVYEVYQSVLVIGNIFSGALQVGGATKQALWLQNTVEQWDIGEKMGDGLYDGIYNLATGNATPN